MPGSDSSGSAGGSGNEHPLGKGDGSGSADRRELPAEGEGEGDTPGEPSDEVMLEDSEAQAAAGGGGDSMDSETDVLEAALEAMERSRSEPSLDEPGLEEPSPDESASAAGQGGAGSGQGMSQGASDIAVLNQELDAALSRFDGDLRSAQAEARQAAEEAGSDTEQRESVALLDPPQDSGVSGDYGEALPGRSSEEIGRGSGAEGTEGDTSSGSGMSGVGGGKAREGDYTHTARAGVVPPDIPSGDDDDVAARQIREAAMKETDPELREKLWDEYRRYKGISKRKS